MRRSALIARDPSVSAGISPIRSNRLTTGDPPTNDQRWSTSVVPASYSASVACALPMADATFARLRTIPGSASSRAASSSPYPATRVTSNPSKARR